LRGGAEHWTKQITQAFRSKARLGVPKEKRMLKVGGMPSESTPRKGNTKKRMTSEKGSNSNTVHRVVMHGEKSLRESSLKKKRAQCEGYNGKRWKEGKEGHRIEKP